MLSHGQNDSGLFETNLRDERLLPFEGAGLVDSEWHLSLPQERAFDYDSIADVVFSIRYTAKSGAGARGVRSALSSADRYDNIIPANGNSSLNVLAGDLAGGFLMLSMKNDLPAEWQAYLSSTGATRTMNVPLTTSRFPSIAEKATSLTIKSVRPVVVHRGGASVGMLAISAPGASATSVDLTIASSTSPALTTGVYTNDRTAGAWTITTDSTNGPHLNDNDHSDLILIVRYTMT